MILQYTNLKHLYDSYLQFESDYDDGTFSLYVQYPGWNNQIQYQNEYGVWNNWNGKSIPAIQTYIGNSYKYIIRLRGYGNTRLSVGYNENRFQILGTSNNVKCIGSINSLLNYKIAKLGRNIHLDNGAFKYLFYSCSKLTKAPDLPSTMLSQSCYYQMFYNCTNLIYAPSLPAENLTRECYYRMFSGCTSLTDAPSLPAMSLDYQCYCEMFSGCSSLISAPELPATTLSNGCYMEMFKDCSSLENAPELHATTLAMSCYMNMFYRCYSLTYPPELLATELSDQCYSGMFGLCTGLIKIPKLPAKTLKYHCYYEMFIGCSSLKISETEDSQYKYQYKIPCVGSSSSVEFQATYDMFSNTGGSFTGTPLTDHTYYLDVDSTPELKRVGGTIFYIDESSYGAIYLFYDSNGNIINNIKVGDIPYNYLVSGTPDKDKYYIFNESVPTLWSRVWTYKENGTWVYNYLNTGSSIGTGKNNTDIVMSADNGKYITNRDGVTIWYDINNININNTEGCNDWYSPSKDELNALRNAVDINGDPLTNIPSSYMLWSSTENGYLSAYYTSSSGFYLASKDAKRSIFCIRSF